MHWGDGSSPVLRGEGREPMFSYFSKFKRLGCGELVTAGRQTAEDRLCETKVSTPEVQMFVGDTATLPDVLPAC